MTRILRIQTDKIRDNLFYQRYPCSIIPFYRNPGIIALLVTG
jgi:hypothetical protein